MNKLFLLLLIHLPTLPFAGAAETLDIKQQYNCKKGIDGTECLVQENTLVSSDHINTKREWKRRNGDVVLFSTKDVKPLSVRNQFGRYLSYTYSVNGYSNQVEADCRDYTANWLNDNLIFNKNKGWNRISDSKEERILEAKKILDEFCPKINNLLGNINADKKILQSNTKEQENLKKEVTSIQIDSRVNKVKQKANSSLDKNMKYTNDLSSRFLRDSQEKINKELESRFIRGNFRKNSSSDKNSDSSNYLAKAKVLHMKSGKEKEVIRLAKLALSESESSNGYFYRGYAMAKTKNYKAALDDYNNAINLKANNPELFYNRGLVKDKLKDYKGAIADYTKAININTDYIAAYKSRGISILKVACSDFKRASILIKSKDKSVNILIRDYCE